jgi:hypothetical protein
VVVHKVGCTTLLAVSTAAAGGGTGVASLSVGWWVVVLPRDEGVGSAVVFWGREGGVLGNSPGSAALVDLGVPVTAAVAVVRTSSVLSKMHETLALSSLSSGRCDGIGVTGSSVAGNFTGFQFQG